LGSKVVAKYLWIIAEPKTARTPCCLRLIILAVKSAAHKSDWFCFLGPGVVGFLFEQCVDGQIGGDGTWIWP